MSTFNHHRHHHHCSPSSTITHRDATFSNNQTDNAIFRAITRVERVLFYSNFLVCFFLSFLCYSDLVFSWPRGQSGGVLLYDYILPLFLSPGFIGLICTEEGEKNGLEGESWSTEGLTALLLLVYGC